MLQLRLKEKLSRKKFLHVLDDVWNENYNGWDILRRPFITASPGSKILVTTRNEGVVLIMVMFQHMLLPEDECLSVFAQHALGAQNFDSCPNLKETREGIVRR